MGDSFKDIKEDFKLTKHYYGDLVRILFMSAAVLMLITLPFLSDKVPVPLFVSILIIIGIGVFSGITNPHQKWTALLNTAISFFAIFIFEYFSIQAYLADSFANLFFITNQLLAIIFLFALYYSTKTLRAMMVNK